VTCAGCPNSLCQALEAAPGFTLDRVSAALEGRLTAADLTEDEWRIFDDLQWEASAEPGKAAREFFAELRGTPGTVGENEHGNLVRVAVDGSLQPLADSWRGAVRPGGRSCTWLPAPLGPARPNAVKRRPRICTPAPSSSTRMSLRDCDPLHRAGALDPERHARDYAKKERAEKSVPEVRLQFQHGLPARGMRG
jgi:hypothetical protein